MDIYPAELPDEPDNLECEIWNLNHRLTDAYGRDTYDLVHSRCVAPGIEKDRWSGYIRDLARVTARGGWVQCAEFYYNIQSDSGRLEEHDSLYQWGKLYREAIEIDRDPRVGRVLGDKMRRAGLHDVHTRTFNIPIGGWPTGE